MVYVYMEVRVANSSACYAYVMCVELGHYHFLYKRSNHWKRHGHKMFKNGTVYLGVSLVSSLLSSALLL